MFWKKLNLNKVQLIKNRKGLALLTLSLVAVTGLVCYEAGAFFKLPGLFQQELQPEELITEGPLLTGTVTAGPFDLHRKYRSMEGPFVNFEVKVSDLVASKNIDLPENMVSFSEGNGPAPSMNKKKAPTMMGSKPNPDEYTLPKGVVQGDSKPALYWFKGVKLEVIDENGKIMPTAEFICHWNLDIDPALHDTMFAKGQKCDNSRLDSISQGETTQVIPKGYGFPLAGNEVLQLSFQAANRTTSQHRRVRHRCTIYLLKDRDLVSPVQALYYYVPYICVVVDHNMPPLSAEQAVNCSRCFGASVGLDAPNDVAGGVFSDKRGRRLSGHWVIPPGVSTYHDVIGPERDPGFPSDSNVAQVVCAWTHVHPLCTSLSLIEVHKDQRRTVFTGYCQTKTDPGLQIMHLDYVKPPAPISLNPVGSNYEMEITYNNTTGKALDSMGSMGIYFADYKFERPDWARPDFKGQFCALKPGSNFCALSHTTGGAPATYPRLDAKTLGPIMAGAKQVELTTSAGPIDIELDPKMAPKTATYMYKLFKSGVLNGTKIYEYSAGFNLGIAMPEDKAPGQPPLKADKVKLIRKVPLEISPTARNVEYMLSAAREDDDKDSNIGAFSILLGKAPQLDGKYCVFGKVVTNQKTLATLDKIKQAWDANKYFIEKAQTL